MRKIVQGLTEYLYELIYMVPLCLLIAGSLSLYFEVKPNFWEYLAVMLTYGYFLLWKYFGKRARVLLGILSFLLLAGGLGSLIAFLGVDYILLRLYWFIWPFYGLVAYLLGCIMRVFVAKLFVGVGVVIWLLCIMICQLPVPRNLVTASFFLLLVILVELVQRSWKKCGYAEQKMHVVYISAFLVVLVMATHFIPVSDKKCEWTYVKKAYHFTLEEAQSLWYSLPWGGSVNYEKSTVGFSEVGELVGELGEDGEKVMEVKAGVMPGPTLYLAGKVFDTYSGTSWESTDTSMRNNRVLDSLLLMNAAWNYTDGQDNQFAVDYFKECTMDLRYVGIRTNVLFAPTKTLMDDTTLAQNGAKTDGANLVFKRKHGYKTNYSATYYYMNQGNEVFKDFLKADHEKNFENWDRLLINYGLLGNPDFTCDKVQERENEIHELYLPKTSVSPELRAYMDNLFAGASSDAEKLSLLEADLASFHYTLEPGPMPEDIDSPEEFLDYFVLESRQGYCCYFATAFVLMARAEGIPARYVQGFAVPVETTEVIDIYSNMAHAWPEVYFDGLGWVQYEPTPGYANPFDWYTRAEMDALRSGELQIEKEVVEVTESQPSDTQEVEEVDDTPVFTFHWYMVVIPLGLSILGTIFYFLIGKLMEKSRYKTLCMEDRIRVMFKKNIGILTILGKGMEEGETIASYHARLAEEEMELSFLPEYEKMLYSLPLTGAELSKLLDQEEDSYIALCNSVHGKSKLSLWKFVLFNEFKTT